MALQESIRTMNLLSAQTRPKRSFYHPLAQVLTWPA